MVHLLMPYSIGRERFSVGCASCEVASLALWQWSGFSICRVSGQKMSGCMSGFWSHPT